jgi:small-conductance mechanosensitive channel
MHGFMQLVGSNRAVQILGIRLVGANAENGKKLIFTVAFLAALVLLRWIIKTIISPVIPGHPSEGFKFWSRQAVNVTFAALVILGLVSIWFDDPTRLTTAAGLVTAGLAFASQRAITSLAGYFIILRGKTFNVGDRIQMGGVRGDVIALGFMQTTIMEMGQAPGEQSGSECRSAGRSCRMKIYRGNVFARTALGGPIGCNWDALLRRTAWTGRRYSPPRSGRFIGG